MYSSYIMCISQLVPPPQYLKRTVIKIYVFFVRTNREDRQMTAKFGEYDFTSLSDVIKMIRKLIISYKRDT